MAGTASESEITRDAGDGLSVVGGWRQLRTEQCKKRHKVQGRDPSSGDEVLTGLPWTFELIWGALFDPTGPGAEGAGCIAVT